MTEEQVTDEALDAAAETVAADTVQASDEVVPEEGTDAPEEGTEEPEAISVSEEEAEEVEVPEEPEDHGERSALGRKVGDNYRELTNELEQMKRELDSFKQGVQSVQPTQQPRRTTYIMMTKMIPDDDG